MVLPCSANTKPKRVAVVLCAIATFLLPLAATACTAEEPTPTPPAKSTATPVAAAALQTYRISTPYDVVTLDPALANGFEDVWLVATALFNRLYSYDADAQLYPDLAASLPASSDNLTHTIRLRNGVRFHNGRELTAHDVHFTLQRVQDPALGSWAVEPLFAGAVFTVVDDLMLRIALREPRTPQQLAALLASSAYGVVPREAVIAAGKDWGHGVVIGTGPFKLGAWAVGEKLVLMKHAAYFKPNQPQLESIALSVNTVAVVALERWKNGEAEFVWLDEASPEFNQLHQDQTLKANLRTAPALAHYVLTMNPRSAALQNESLRKAIFAAASSDAQPQVARDLWRAAGFAEATLPELVVALGVTEPARLQPLQAALLTAGFRTRLLLDDMAVVDEGWQAGAIDLWLRVTTSPNPAEDLVLAQAQWVGLGRSNVTGDVLHPRYGLPILETAVVATAR